MSTITFDIRRTQLPADETTPVRLYRQLRAFFSPAVLLESNNFSEAREARSIIGIDPLIELRFSHGELIRTYFPDAEETIKKVPKHQVLQRFEEEVKKINNPREAKLVCHR